MSPEKARKTIKIITVTWVIVSILLAVVVFAGILPKAIFTKIFLGGFVAYAIAATVLTQMTFDS